MLVRLLNQRAPELGEHVIAVKGLALAVGEELGMGPGELTTLGRASELHDIGKIAIPDAVLTKSGPLDEEEWEFIHQHTILGERIVSAAPSLASVGNLIRSSHERWDGTGYPDQLAGEEIPLAARIILVCDAYDAMTSARPYSPSRDPERPSRSSAAARARSSIRSWWRSSSASSARRPPSASRFPFRSPERPNETGRPAGRPVCSGEM